MSGANSTGRGGRPVLRHSSLSGGSFLQDHQQYKHASYDVPNIGDVLRSPPKDSLKTPPLPLNGNLAKTEVKDSGIVHSIFNESLASLPPNSPRVVATIYYKASDPVHPHLHPDSYSSSRSRSTSDNLPRPTVAPGSAPTLNLDQLPREPPAADPEPLDHLYGPYVSQLCLANFLQMMEELSTPYQRVASSHRCLDKEDQPRVVEVTLCPPPNPDYLSFNELRKHESLWRFEREWNVEVVLQREGVYRRNKRLAVFDMDSTLIQQEVIDEIAKFIGVDKEVSVCFVVSKLFQSVFFVISF